MRIRLDQPSRLDMIEAADRLVVDLATFVGFDADSTEDIRTAVHESVMNAITHGNLVDPTRRVSVDLAIHPGALEIWIQDEGRGFEPSQVPDPLAGENLTKPSGRGIFLMRAFMDAVSFSRSANGGTRVRMLKRVRRAAGDSAHRPRGHNGAERAGYAQVAQPAPSAA
jgi:serine/threonine-protein kinase RsbW